MKTRSLISSSLAIALAATPSFAKKNNHDLLGDKIWHPNWTTPADNNGRIYYGSTKSPSTALTKFESTKIEFKSSDTPPPIQTILLLKNLILKALLPLKSII